MYIYEDHFDGSLYTSCRPLDYEERHCKKCKDVDLLLGYATTRKEACELLKSSANIDGWNHNYIQAFIAANWDK